MPDSKYLSWAEEYGAHADAPAETPRSRVTPQQPAANDADGWQQYRQWVTKAPAPRSRRAGIDPALYTWKGYRNWSEKIKRDWQPDAAPDED